MSETERARKGDGGDSKSEIYFSDLLSSQSMINTKILPVRFGARQCGTMRSQQQGVQSARHSSLEGVFFYFLSEIG